MKGLNKYIGLLVFVLVLISVFFLWDAYSPKSMNVVEAKPELHLTAETLIANFKTEKNYALTPEKIVEIEGIVKEISNLNNRMTVLLEGGTNESACVICDMQEDQTKDLKNIKPKDTIRLKGVFKGFLKDAIFLHCVISQRTINE
ncbi:OB-fold putative lipoprotein [Zobellia sp.]|nr:OB-fold putative lipoprotein [Zobellia sp.]